LRIALRLSEEKETSRHRRVEGLGKVGDVE